MRSVRAARARLGSVGTRVAIAVCLVASSPPASANGRFPSAGQIVVDPSDPKHIVVRATYSLLTTRDGGGQWDWICEPSIGYSGVEDPAVSITSDGTIIAGLFAGLSVAHGNSCDWDFPEALSKVEVVDTSINRASPSMAVAIGVTSNRLILWACVT